MTPIDLDDVYSRDYEMIDEFQVFAVSIPVNIGYKARCSKTVTIDPYIGLNFKFNAMLRERIGYNNAYYLDHPGAEDDLTWTNLRSDCPSCGVGSDDLVWNLFQLGWHVGAGITIKKFYIGISYGTDFTKAWKLDNNHVSSSTIKASIGFVI